MDAPPTPRQSLLRKEGLCTLVCLALLGLAAALYPLAPVGNGQAAAPASAPWVFLGFQQLLRWLPAWLEDRPGPAVPAYGRPSALALAAWLVLAVWAGLTAWALLS
ncbi:MAG: hypothetical protein AB1814_07250 [Thermodesulfobacteriota bacterium]